MYTSTVCNNLVSNQTNFLPNDLMISVKWAAFFVSLSRTIKIQNLQTRDLTLGFLSYFNVFLVLSIFPLLPTISDTENRLLVLGSELCGIILYQTNYSNGLKSDRLVNINLWCSLLIKTMMVLSGAFNQEPPSIVIYFSWFCFIISFITPFYERIQIDFYYSLMHVTSEGF